MRRTVLRSGLVLAVAVIAVRWNPVSQAGASSHIVTKQFVIPGNRSIRPNVYRTHTYTVPCPQGETVTGGGYQLANTSAPGPADSTVMASYPQNNLTWTVVVRVEQAKSFSFTVYGICS